MYRNIKYLIHFFV